MKQLLEWIHNPIEDLDLERNRRQYHKPMSETKPENKINIININIHVNLTDIWYNGCYKYSKTIEETSEQNLESKHD